MEYYNSYITKLYCIVTFKP